MQIKRKMMREGVVERRKSISGIGCSKPFTWKCDMQKEKADEQIKNEKSGIL